MSAEVCECGPAKYTGASNPSFGYTDSSTCDMGAMLVAN